MHQLLLRMTLPKGCVFWPDELRIAVARQDKLIAPVLMGRGDDGRTLARPPVRFVGGRSWIGLVADPGHEDVLYAHVGQVIRAASQQVGAPLNIQVEQHELGLRRTSEPVFYSAMNVAMKRRSAVARERTAADLFVARLVNALERQAEAFGLDCPLPDELDVANIAIERQMGMGLKTDQGQTGEFVTLLPRIEFSMFAELDGFWFAGSLCSRGYGRMVKMRRFNGKWGHA